MMMELYDNAILIVDDEEDIRLLFKSRLSEYVSEVYTAANGEDALSILENKRIDLAFLDIKMPFMDGMTLFKNIESQSAHTICVFVSAFADRDNVKEALKFGAYDFIEKPVEFDLLDNCVYRCLEKANYEKIQKEILELLLYHYSDLDPNGF